MFNSKLQKPSNITTLLYTQLIRGSLSIVFAVVMVSSLSQGFAMVAGYSISNTTTITHVQNTLSNWMNNMPSLSYQSSFPANGANSALTYQDTISSLNDPPNANNDVIIMPHEDRQLNVDILKNDLDADGDKLTIINASNPVNGTTQIIRNNDTLIYKPNPNFHGPDTFNYEISDGHNGTDMGIVRVNVSSVNDIPVANNDTFITKEDAIPKPLNLLANDTDIDREDRLTVALITPPRNGSAYVNDNNGTVSYKPGPNFNGMDTFNYEISDGHNGTDMGIVRVNVSSVNDIPVANNNRNITDEDKPIINFNVLSNDKDVDIGDSIRIIGITQPLNGTSTYSNNTVSYQPDANFNSNDSFSYIIVDTKNGTDKGTVSIQVKPVNDPPIASNDTVVTFEDLPLVINILKNDTDVDSNRSSLYIGNITKFGVTNGNVSTNVDHTITYTPTPAGRGKDYFRYTVLDEYGKSDIGTLTVTIKSVLETVSNFLHDQFSVSPRTRTFLTIQMFPSPTLLQGDSSTDLSIKGKLAYLANGSGIKHQPINIEIQKNNQTQASSSSMTDLIYDLTKGRDVNAQTNFKEEAVTDGSGNYNFTQPLPLGHGKYTVISYPRNDQSFNVSTPLLIERPPLPISDIASSLIPILTITGIGIAALRVVPKHRNKKKQSETVLMYIDKITNATTKLELRDLEKDITDLILENKITKEHFDILEHKITEILQKFK